MNAKKRKERPIGPRKAAALRALFDDASALTAAVRMAEERLWAARGATPGHGRRELLALLAEGGPATVPNLAKARGVSRQNAQVAVNALRDAGLVEAVDNPQHRRSPLIALTDDGRTAAAALQDDDSDIFATIQLDLSRNDIRDAARTLHAISTALQHRDGDGGGDGGGDGDGDD